MKIFSTAFAPLFFFTLLSPQAQALECRDLQKLQTSSDFLKARPYASANGRVLTQMIQQLRVTLKTFTGEDVSRLSAEELDVRADGATFSSVTLGALSYQAVNVSLGENPYVLLFENDSLKPSGIAIHDGTVEVNGRVCDVSLPE